MSSSSPSSRSQRAPRVTLLTACLLIASLAHAQLGNAQLAPDNNLASQDLFPPAPSSSVAGDSNKGYLAQLTEQERKAAQDRFLFGDAHLSHALLHARLQPKDHHVPDGGSGVSGEEEVKAQPALVGSKSAASSGSIMVSEPVYEQRKSTSTRKNTSRRSRRRRRRAYYDEDDDEDDEDDDSDDSYSTSKSKHGTGLKLFSILSWLVVRTFTSIGSLFKTIYTMLVVPPILFLISSIYHMSMTLYHNTTYLLLHTLRPIRMLVVAPVAYLLLGIYHVFLEIPLGVFSILAKELYPLYLFLGAATTVGLGLGTGAGLVLLAGSFVFKNRPKREEGGLVEGAQVAAGAKAQSKSGKAKLERVDDSRQRGKAAAGVKTASKSKRDPKRRRSLIGEAIQDLKRRESASRFDEDEEGDGAGMWSEEEEEEADQARGAGSGFKSYTSSSFSTKGKQRAGFTQEDDLLSPTTTFYRPQQQQQQYGGAGVGAGAGRGAGYNPYFPDDGVDQVESPVAVGGPAASYSRRF